jgi:glutaredoxin
MINLDKTNVELSNVINMNDETIKKLKKDIEDVTDDMTKVTLGYNLRNVPYIIISNKHFGDKHVPAHKCSCNICG